MPLYYKCNFFDSNSAYATLEYRKIYLRSSKFCLVVDKFIFAVPAVEFTDLLADFLRLMLRS